MYTEPQILNIFFWELREEKVKIAQSRTEFQEYIQVSKTLQLIQTSPPESIESL